MEGQFMSNIWKATPTREHKLLGKQTTNLKKKRSFKPSVLHQHSAILNLNTIKISDKNQFLLNLIYLTTK